MFLDYKYRTYSKIQKETFKFVNNSTNKTRIKILQKQVCPKP
jgi:hypothetical protein